MSSGVHGDMDNLASGPANILPCSGFSCTDALAYGVHLDCAASSCQSLCCSAAAMPAYSHTGY